MLETTIQVDNIDDVTRRLGRFGSKAPSVIANAINRTTTNIKKNMASETSAKYYITSGDVKSTISIAKASKANPIGRTTSKASPIALSKFKVNPNRPVSYNGKKASPKVYKVAVKKGESEKNLDGNPKGFIAIMKSSHKGLFSRTSKNSLPIKQLYGPSVPQMIKNEKSMEKIEREAKSTLERRIDAEINNILRRGAMA